MSRSCSLFTDSLHNSADHLGRHAELRGVQHGKDLVRRRDQAPLFGEADDEAKWVSRRVSRRVTGILSSNSPPSGCADICPEVG